MNNLVIVCCFYLPSLETFLKSLRMIEGHSQYVVRGSYSWQVIVLIKDVSKSL